MLCFADAATDADALACPPPLERFGGGAQPKNASLRMHVHLVVDSDSQGDSSICTGGASVKN